MVSLHIAFPIKTPPAVPKAKAKRPKPKISRTFQVSTVSAAIVAPIQSARKRVTIFMSSFPAVLANLSTTPLSRSRLPNINIPIRGAALGSNRITITVTMMGNRMSSCLETVRDSSMTMALSSLVVRSLIIGG